MLSVADIPIAGKHLFGLFRGIWNWRHVCLNRMENPSKLLKMEIWKESFMKVRLAGHFTNSEKISIPSLLLKQRWLLLNTNIHKNEQKDRVLK